jgi:hypothetical protein
MFYKVKDKNRSERCQLSGTGEEKISIKAALCSRARQQLNNQKVLIGTISLFFALYLVWVIVTALQWYSSILSFTTL